MRSELYDLRLACRNYPRSDLVIAVDAALQGLGIDDNERSGLATLTAAWLLDEEWKQYLRRPPSGR